MHAVAESENEESRDDQSGVRHNQENMPTEGNDSTTLEQLATCTGASSGGHSESQPATPTGGGQRNSRANQFICTKEGQKNPETKEDRSSDTKEKVDYIVDFLHNKLGKIIEEKIKESQRNTAAHAQARELAVISSDQQQDRNAPTSPTDEKQDDDDNALEKDEGP
ncbi:hypothetical protein C0J52_08381 [Blattella germanica]|nr:hypothetical protein C0J52_08381 [Blattella germanica]